MMTVKERFDELINMIKSGVIAEFSAIADVKNGRINTTIKVVAEDGTEFKISVQPPRDSDEKIVKFKEEHEQCPSCGGWGKNPYSYNIDCLVCNGSGYVRKEEISKYLESNPNKENFLNLIAKRKEMAKEQKESKQDE